jgi:hypothetical protein
MYLSVLHMRRYQTPTLIITLNDVIFLNYYRYQCVSVVFGVDMSVRLILFRYVLFDLDLNIIKLLFEGVLLKII